MHYKIIVLYNTFSAKGRGKKIVESIINFYANSIQNFDFYENNWPTAIDTYKEIWIIGGDGTFNYFLNYYSEINIPILFFAGGTGNDIHWKLYGNTTLETQLRTIEKYTTQPVDIAICTIDNIEKKYFMNGVGIGFDGEVLKSMKTVRLLGGHLGYLFVVIRQIFSFKERDYKLQFNNQQTQQKYTILNIANSSRTGGGFMVSPKADINDGWLNLMMCYIPSILQRLKILPLVEKGKHLELPVVEHHLIKQLSIQTDNTVYAQIDGELVAGKHFDIQLSTHQLAIKY